jgi:hypothetical protein
MVLTPSRIDLRPANNWALIYLIIAENKQRPAGFLQDDGDSSAPVD